MPNLREAILNELKHRGWSNYQLVQALKGKRPGKKDVPPATIYQFLAGDTDIRTADLGLICDALGMELKRKR